MLQQSPINRKQVRQSNFKKQRRSSIGGPKDSNFKQESRFQQQYNFKRSIDSKQSLIEQNKTSRQESVISIKSLDPKFFTFLNDFSNKLENLKKKNLEGLSQQSYNSQFIQQKGDTKSMASIMCTNTGNNTTSRIKKRNSLNRESFQIIEASLNEGKIHGSAKLILKNGEVFTGKVQFGDLKYGKVVYQSGLQYEGFFENNIFHGQGIVKAPNGSIINLQWNNGQPSLNGKITYKNGDIYIGQIFEYKKHGIGQLKLANGRKYIGQFGKGLINGKGTLYQKNGQIRAEGLWYQGKLIKTNSQTQQSDFTESS